MNEVKIVVADDDASLVVLLERLLTNAGHTVLTCDNGTTAFKLVQQHAPVLLIADWEMPGLTGLELCRKIRSSQASGGTYILLLTGDDEQTQVVAGLEAGADDYLVKTRSHTELLARVRAGARLLKAHTTTGSTRTFSTKALTAVALATLGVLALAGWNLWSAQRATVKTLGESLRIHELVGKILHLDEVLTMSARMAAATGDLQWEDRYRGFEPDLDQAIKEAVELAPTSFEGEGAVQTNAANVKLVEMENRAFDLVDQGQHEAARDMLSSEEYEEQKRIYAAGMRAAHSGMDGRIDAQVGSDRTRMAVAGWVAAAAMMAMATAWLGILLVVARHMRARGKAEASLRGAYGQLEARVEQRTAALRQANEQLTLEITDRGRIEARLRNSEERHRAICESANDAIVTADAQGKIHSWNAAAEKIFGFSASEAIGRDTLELIVPPKYHEAKRKGMASFADTGKGNAVGATLELTALRSDGSEFPISFSLSAYEGRNGFVAVALIRDITEQKKAEQAQRRLAHAVDAAAEAILITDTSGRILQVNAAFFTITGYSENDVIGQTPRLLKSGRQSSEYYKRLWDTIRAGDVWSGRFVNRHKCGALYSADLTIAPITDDDGKVTGYVGVHRDVTDQVEREQELATAKNDAEAALAELQQAHAQLLQADKMASIGNLAAGVAHEINNPIGFITSNLNSLNEYAADLGRVLGAYDELLDECRSGRGPLSAKAEEVIRVREQADIDYVMSDLGNLIAESTDGAKRVRQIVADLRDFSHVDSPDIADEDINALLDKTVSVAWNELKYKTEVVKEYGDVPLIPCYGGKLGQVFLNLLVNAAHAIEERGTITIRTALENDRVCIEIADTGTGIPEENLGRIFDPFFTTKAVGSGTGLGLHLTFKIIEAHAGRIDVESRVGQGTTFRIELPATGPQAVKESERESVT